MDSYLELAENLNPDASSAMEIAGQLRQAGWDSSSALKEGWRRARGEGGGNPDFEASPLSQLLLFAGLGTVIHRLITKQWWWELISLAKQKKLAVTEAQRIARQAQQNNPAPPPSTGGVTVIRPYNPATGEDPISIIEV